MGESPQIFTKTWQWQGFPIRYQTAGTQGPAVVLIHGFGASSDHWRKNLPVLAQTCRVYALDLIGYGQSAKPQPGPLYPGQSIEYCFETWGDQVAAFSQDVVGGSAFLIGNSIGCIVALQTAVEHSHWVTGVIMLNCSLRLLHERKRSTLPWHRRWGTVLIQSLLSYRPLGHYFFKRMAQPKTIRQILSKAYACSEAITDELITFIHQPAQEPGAVDVFLAFIQYAQGPLPEELLLQIACPALILWGAADPWEPIDQARKLADCPAVEGFIPLEGVGHCPQDEAPEVVNPILQRWILDKNKTVVLQENS